MENPLKELLNQFAENAKRAPGWLPLLVLCYLGFLLVPGGTTLLGVSLRDHKEIIVTTVTLLLYLLGDALDKPVFKRLSPRWLDLDENRQKARKALSIEEGSYRVSKALAVAAGKYEGSWIQVKNESAKMLRSLVFPSALMGTLFAFRGPVWLGVSAIAASFALLLCYVQLKASHMADLYRLTQSLVNDEGYEAHDLTGTVRLFFWKGELVSSGLRFTQPHKTPNG